MLARRPVSYIPTVEDTYENLEYMCFFKLKKLSNSKKME